MLYKFKNIFINMIMFLNLYKSLLSKKKFADQNEQNAIKSDEEKLLKLKEELDDRNPLLERAKKGAENEQSLLNEIKKANKKYNTILNNI